MAQKLPSFNNFIQANMPSYMGTSSVMGGLASLTPQSPQVQPKDVLPAGTKVITTEGASMWLPAGSEGEIAGIAAYDTYRVDFPNGASFFLNSREHFKLITKTKAKKAKPKISMDSVILDEEKKEQIRSTIDQAKNEFTIFEKWGFAQTFEKGTAISLLFWGIPGTGKTLMAEAIAAELGHELKIYGTAEIQSMEPGGAERTIQEIFKTANSLNATGKNRIILLDECDSLLTDRAELGPILSAEVNCLLGEIERYNGIVIFTTNRLGKLDPALERRISAKIEFTFPNLLQRSLIWQRMFPKKAPLEKIDFSKLARHHLAGGNIKNAVLAAVRQAARQKMPKITQDLLDTAALRETASLKAFMNEYDKNPHYNLHGYTKGERGGLTIDKKQELEKTLRKGDNML